MSSFPNIRPDIGSADDSFGGQLNTVYRDVVGGTSLKYVIEIILIQIITRGVITNTFQH